MPRTHLLTDADRQEIARQIGNSLSRRHPNGKQTWWAGTHGSRRAILAESFQIWTLSNSALDALHHGLEGIHPEQRLIEFTENTRRYHHQIRREDGQAVGFAQSMRSKGQNRSDVWRLQAVKMSSTKTTSSIADAMGKAIKWIDGHVAFSVDGEGQQDEHLVRLLVIPQYHLHAFWLEGRDSDKILVVHIPKTRPRLKYHKLYTWYKFFDALSKEKPIGFVMPHAAKTGAPPRLRRSVPPKRGRVRPARKM